MYAASRQNNQQSNVVSMNKKVRIVLDPEIDAEVLMAYQAKNQATCRCSEVALDPLVVCPTHWLSTQVG
jgi:hypothetical protein